jgi:hypothetical protein
MNVFDSFLTELHTDLPDLDLAPLEDVLHDIEYESDALALALFGAVRWAAKQTKYPALARLKFIEQLFDRAIARAD